MKNLVGMSEFRLSKIPIPPLPEQKAIATALSDTDNWIESLEKLISKKKAIKQGAMQELLTGRVRLRSATGETFKGEWEEKTLGEIALITMGQSPLSENYNQKEIGLPLVQGNADIKNRKTIRRNYTSQITKTGIVGDIIMTVRAPVGHIGKALFKCCLGRGVCGIRYQNDYLYHFLIFIENDWNHSSTGSTFDSVNSTQLSQSKINLPTNIEEQIAIAQVLSDMDKEIEVLENKLEKARKIKVGMMQQLLTGKIRLLNPVQ